MFENAMLLLVVMCIVLLTVWFIAYMRGQVDYKMQVFPKIWYLFRHTVLKAEILIGYGIYSLESIIRNKEKEEFSQYTITDPKSAGIKRKEQKLFEMENTYHTHYRHRKNSYNMKILK